MSGNVIQGPFYNSGFYDTGAGGGWKLSTAIINGDIYQTITNGSVEWLAQNFNEILPGLTLANESDYNVYGDGRNQCYRFGAIKTEYDKNSIIKFCGTCYRAGARNIINTSLASDGWHIPSRSEWNALIDSLDDIEDLCVPNTPGDYNQLYGKNKTGFSIITTPNPGGSNLSDFDFSFGGTSINYMVNELARGRGDDYVVLISFLNGRPNVNGPYYNTTYYGSTWNEKYFIRLVRTL